MRLPAPASFRAPLWHAAAGALLLAAAWGGPILPAQTGADAASSADAATEWVALARAMDLRGDAPEATSAMARFATGEVRPAPLRELLAARPLEAAAVIDAVAGDLAAAAASSPRDLVHRLSELAGAPTRRGLGRSPLLFLDEARAAGEVPAAADYLAEWWEVEAGTRPLSREVAAARDATLALLAGRSDGGAPPLDERLWELTWYLCEAARQADVLRAEAFAALAPEEADDLRAMVLDACVARSPERPDPVLPLRFAGLAHRVERSLLFSAAVDLAIAADAAREEMRVLAAEAPAGGAPLWLATPLGWVRLAADAAPEEVTLPREGLPLLLSLDLGGDDTYTFAELNPAWAPVVLVLDAGGGEDRYLGHHAATVGGLALAWDGGGADRHEGSFAQAAAAFGVALLFDEGEGEDAYEGLQRAQGVALFGAAALVESGGGATAYRLISMGQGLGEPGGAAALVDLAGDDTYLLGATAPYFPSALRPDRNASLGQGMGLGYRTEHDPGGVLAGGAGLLVDLAGDDTFEAEVQAQGAGFWFGVGALVDRAGADRRRAIAFAAGAASHHGAGIVVDGAGHDAWSVEEEEGIAAAEEGGLAVVVDRAGGDVWRAPAAGLGVARSGGVALWADLGGDDDYRLGGTAVFGAVEAAPPGTLGALRPAIALAWDATGSNTFAWATGGVVPSRFAALAARDARLMPASRVGDRAATGVARLAGRVEGAPRR